MTEAPHAFENDVIIEQEVTNGEVIYSAYADGNLIKRYPPAKPATRWLRDSSQRARCQT